MQEMIDLLVDQSISELIIFHDQLTEAIPTLPQIFACDQLRLRMQESLFTVRTAPALWSEHQSSVTPGTIVFIHDSAEELELVESEKSLIKNDLYEHDFYEIDFQNEELNYSESPINSSEILHLSTHNIPASRFTDPMFISTSLKSNNPSVNLAAVQDDAIKLGFKLVVLNGCSTATTKSGNYYNMFKTNEKAGLSTVFMLNRNCVVLATKWKIPEIISFLFTSLL